MIRRLLLAASLLPWMAVWAQDTTTVAPTTTAPQTQASGKRNSLDLYAGLRTNGGTDFMMGAKFTQTRAEWKNLGFSGFLEVVFANDTEFLLGALAAWTPTPRLLLETGPGFAFDGGSDFFWRIAGEYEMQIGRRLRLVPKGYVDFIHGTTVFGYGLAIGGR
jgi:hypothetical protein